MENRTGFLQLIKNSSKELKKLPNLCVSAMLLALRVILGSITVLVIPVVKVGFSFLPTAIGGILYGPVVSGLIGALGDVLSYIVNPVGGAYFPGFTINGNIIGMIYGCFLYNKKITLKRVILCELTISIVVELLLSSLWLMMFYGYAFFAILSARLVKEAISFPIKVALIMTFSKITSRLLFLRRGAAANSRRHVAAPDSRSKHL